MNGFTSPIENSEVLNIEENQQTSTNKSLAPTTPFKDEQLHKSTQVLKMNIILEQPSLKKKFR
jgi:hypothetical protein